MYSNSVQRVRVHHTKKVASFEGAKRQTAYAYVYFLDYSGNKTDDELHEVPTREVVDRWEDWILDYKDQLDRYIEWSKEQQERAERDRIAHEERERRMRERKEGRINYLVGLGVPKDWISENYLGRIEINTVQLDRAIENERRVADGVGQSS